MSIKWTKGVEAKARELLGEDEFERFKLALIKNPLKGDKIPGTLEARKMRFPYRKKGIGTSYGIRIVYYIWIKGRTVFIFDVYPKDQKQDITDDEKKAINDFIKIL